MKLDTDSVLGLNNILLNLIERCKKENADVELATALTNALIEMLENKEEIKEMKKYEFACEIELYPMVQYIEANSADEAVELMEQQIEDSAFLQDLTVDDFHCQTADQIKVTKEYKKYIDKHKITLEDKICQ